MAYSGPKEQEFQKAVTLLNESATNLFKEILKQDETGAGTGSFSGVKTEFPRVLTASLAPAAITPETRNRENELIIQTKKLIEAIKCLKDLESSLDRDQPKREHSKRDHSKRDHVKTWEFSKPLLNLTAT